MKGTKLKNTTFCHPIESLKKGVRRRIRWPKSESSYQNGIGGMQNYDFRRDLHLNNPASKIAETPDAAAIHLYKLHKTQ